MHIHDELDTNTFEIRYKCTLYNKVEYFSMALFELDAAIRHCPQLSHLGSVQIRILNIFAITAIKHWAK